MENETIEIDVITLMDCITHSGGNMENEQDYQNFLDECGIEFHHLEAIFFNIFIIKDQKKYFLAKIKYDI